MAKITVIEACRDCNHLRWNQNGKNVCGKTRKEFLTIDIVQPSCPLPSGMTVESINGMINQIFDVLEAAHEEIQQAD